MPFVGGGRERKEGVEGKKKCEGGEEEGGREKRYDDGDGFNGYGCDDGDKGDVGDGADDNMRR